MRILAKLRKRTNLLDVLGYLASVAWALITQSHWLKPLRRKQAGSPPTGFSAGREPPRPVGLTGTYRCEEAFEQASSHFEALPIVVAHCSNSDYLQYTLAQAKSTNPHSTIYLLGDNDNTEYPFVEHRMISEYSRGADRFAEVYRHYTTIPVQYDLFWFTRWFVLRDFLSEAGINRCLYIDSDVLLYTNVTAAQTRFSQYDFTISHGMCGCVFFLNRRQALSDFCDFVMDVFSGKDAYHHDRMLGLYVAMRKNMRPGGICDMTLLQFFAQANFGRIGEVSEIIEGSLFDPNVNIEAPGMQMDGGMKHLWWHEGVPYGRHVRTKQEVQFHSLHFQGRAKQRMASCFSGDPLLLRSSELAVGAHAG
jgi:hypothetical protein